MKGADRAKLEALFIADAVVSLWHRLGAGSAMGHL
jgi:hypothetical protein